MKKKEKSMIGTRKKKLKLQDHGVMSARIYLRTTQSLRCTCILITRARFDRTMKVVILPVISFSLFCDQHMVEI